MSVVKLFHKLSIFCHTFSNLFIRLVNWHSLYLLLASSLEAFSNGAFSKDPRSFWTSSLSWEAILSAGFRSDSSDIFNISHMWLFSFHRNSTLKALFLCLCHYYFASPHSIRLRIKESRSLLILHSFLFVPVNFMHFKRLHSNSRLSILKLIKVNFSIMLSNAQLHFPIPQFKWAG